jgi:hypothetical protein
VEVDVNENDDRRHATRRGLSSRLRSGYERKTSFHRLRPYEAIVFKDGRKNVYEREQRRRSRASQTRAFPGVPSTPSTIDTRSRPTCTELSYYLKS